MLSKRFKPGDLVTGSGRNDKLGIINPVRDHKPLLVKYREERELATGKKIER
jgi:hypothetical protein